jgi:hypothetical protein
MDPEKRQYIIDLFREMREESTNDAIVVRLRAKLAKQRRALTVARNSLRIAMSAVEAGLKVDAR